MTQRIVVCVECKTEYRIPRTQKRLKSYESCGNDDCTCRKFRAKKRKCAKCRDRKQWSKREEYRGTYWHWFLWGGQTTALAKKCMRGEGHGKG